MHDPGGKTFRLLPPGVFGEALFEGSDSCYRLELRRWSGSAGWFVGKPYALFIGLNPSTANGDVDDNTVALEREIASRLGYSRYLKMNVSPYRSTDPDGLKRAGVPLVPAGHATRLFVRAMRAGQVVAACGVPPEPIAAEAREVLETLVWLGVEVWCLGTTKDAFPRHPLYMPREAPLARWYGFRDVLGPTGRVFMPDRPGPRQDGGEWHVGDVWVTRAPRARRLRDLIFNQVVAVDRTGTPVVIPAGHLANQFKREVDQWAEETAQ